MSLAILFHFLCAQHVLVLKYPSPGACDYSVELPHWSYCSVNPLSLQNNTTNVVIQQNSRKLLTMDILISETC